ncbi:MAG: cyclomaltodextrinase C-terminal domain-containing protein, partial [Croceimicrobium sp.]
QTDQLKGAEAEVNQYLRDLLAWRANSDAIRNGSFLHFVPEYDVYTYFRISESEVVMVLVNSHPKEAREVDLNRFREVWPKNAGAKDVLSQEPAPSDVLKLEPMSVRIFSLKR